MFETLKVIDFAIFEKIHAAVVRSTFATTFAWAFHYAAVGVFVVACLAYLYSHRAERKHVYVIVASAPLAYLLSRLIGFIHFRPRPFVTLNFVPLVNESPLSKSFPSSHTIVAFAVASAIYSYNKKWGLIALVLAACIGIGRVLVGVHYPSDVLAGAVLGVLVSWLVKRFV